LLLVVDPDDDLALDRLQANEGVRDALVMWGFGVASDRGR